MENVFVFWRLTCLHFFGEFPLFILSSTLKCGLSSPKTKDSKAKLIWYLEMTATEDFEREGASYLESYRFEFEAFWFPNQPRRWKEMVGQIIEWDSDSELNQSYSRPSFCYDWHRDIESGSIQFLEQEGCNFRIKWDGENSDFGHLSIDTWVTFESVEIFRHISDTTEPWELLALCLEPDDFVMEPSIIKSTKWWSFKPKI